MGFWFFMLAMNLIIPLSMIFLGKYFSKRAPGQINMLFGYRTARSMKNQDTWQFAHHYFGKLWFKMGLWLLVLTVAAMLPGLGKDADAVGKLGGLLCLAQIPVMLYAIFPTERALKKTFDKDATEKRLKKAASEKRMLLRYLRNQDGCAVATPRFAKPSERILCA